MVKMAIAQEEKYLAYGMVGCRLPTDL